MNCSWLNPIAAPFALLLMFFYKLFQGAPDNESKFAYALALILVAIFVRAIMLPFQMKSKLGMMRQSRLQPKLAEIQKRHAANKQKLSEETSKLYREEGVNPLSGCLWSFIQMPIMLALFYAIRQPLGLMMRLSSELWENSGGAIYNKLMELYHGGALNTNGEFYKALSPLMEQSGGAPVAFTSENLGFYSELYIAQEISEHWDSFKNLGIEGLHRISFYLGNINLAQVPNYRVWEFNWSDGAWLSSLMLFFLPIISGGAQFVSGHINRKMNPQQTMTQEQGGAGMMMKLMPLMSVWFGFMLPAALSIYWTIGTCLQIAQDIWLTKKYTKQLDEEDADKEIARAKKEAEIEAKRLETEKLKAEGIASVNPNVSKRKKQTLEKQDKRLKAVEWEKKNTPKKEKNKDDEPGRVGDRRYARGRAYDPDRFSGTVKESTEEAVAEDKIANIISKDTDILTENADYDNKVTDDDTDEDDYIGYDED